MEKNYQLKTIETHTAGEPTRILVSGINLFPFFGRSVAEQRDLFAEKYDDIRELLMKEPRGHDDMFGAIPVKTEMSEADLGAIFMHTTGYLDMCGHGTIGIVTALIETSFLPEKEKIKIETPAGIVECRARIEADKVKEVSVKNVDSFVIGKKEIELEMTEIKSDVEIDLVYSGNLVGLVDVKDLGYTIDIDELDILKKIGIELRNRLNEENDFINPLTGNKEEVSLLEFYESREDVDRNIVVFADGSIDRSPCGTGTCAKMTLLHHKEILDVDEEYRYQSIIGTEFSGRIMDTDKRQGTTVVKPEITGSAYITGRSTFILDPEDPLTGFSLYK